MDLLDSPAFARHIDELLEQWHVPGLAIALIDHERTRSRAFGSASLDSQRSCTPETLFDLASSSKSLTAASVALLCADDEKHPDIEWGSKMSHLLPDDFVCSQETYTNETTVEDCLSHKTGYPR